jgi:hypothetical protein
VAQSFGKVQPFNVHLEGRGDAHIVQKVHINGTFHLHIEIDAETHEEVLIVQTTTGSALRIQPVASNSFGITEREV